MNAADKAIRARLAAVVPEVEGEFERCPGCREPFPMAGPMPPHSLWLVEDSQIPCGYLVVSGWICGRMLYGTVVMRGPVGAEREPNFQVSHGHSLYIGLKDREITPF